MRRKDFRMSFDVIMMYTKQSAPLPLDIILKIGLYFHVTQLYSHQIRTANQIRRSYDNDQSDIFVTVYCVT